MVVSLGAGIAQPDKQWVWSKHEFCLFLNQLKRKCRLAAKIVRAMYLKANQYKTNPLLKTDAKLILTQHANLTACCRLNLITGKK